MVIWNMPKSLNHSSNTGKTAGIGGETTVQLLNTDRQKAFFLFKETDLISRPGQLANVAGIAPAKIEKRNISKIA